MLLAFLGALERMKMGSCPLDSSGPSLRVGDRTEESAGLADAADRCRPAAATRAALVGWSQSRSQVSKAGLSRTRVKGVPRGFSYTRTWPETVSMTVIVTP